MSSIILEPKEKLTESKIINAEEEINLKLPSDYKKFLLRTNGGYPEKGAFMIDFGHDRIQIGHVNYFLSIYDGEHSNLVDYVKTYTERLPEGLLPVAYDDQGNLVVLKINGENKGKVYFWDHDQEGYDDYDPEKPEMGFVADNFDKFISELGKADSST
ncbi:hypothetical protein CKO25_11100 [Thiocapsa imhoffii]|uniref:Knr4/Smi1-like domain-containing protein n=1 Tax=Thiocapsa imhoffii TaxID=382777 RepID=A0A9X1B8V4_9GAMM|nr:SMI1/KNR4 family protein [Thiocapsa imhoffii]MBK1645182.1 hypothetical protein [Thiocapsa imhoffii]